MNENYPYIGYDLTDRYAILVGDGS